MSNVTAFRIIAVERLRRPDGWFLVVMNDGAADEYSAAWETSELAFADADSLKRTYAPAIIRDRTGGAS
ncbi:MAG: hypothetical protein M9955_19670 [Rhizobiaceae bacterium]|nr:hypothetical protein [Rhizobiaceae bacterium]